MIRSKIQHVPSMVQSILGSNFAAASLYVKNIEIFSNLIDNITAGNLDASTQSITTTFADEASIDNNLLILPLHYVFVTSTGAKWINISNSSQYFTLNSVHFNSVVTSDGLDGEGFTDWYTRVFGTAPTLNNVGAWLKGNKGIVGIDGAQGLKGDQGATGATGIQGATGATGADGTYGTYVVTDPEASVETTLSQAVAIGYDHYYDFKSDNLTETPDLIGNILLDYDYPVTEEQFTSVIVEDTSPNAAALQIDPTTNNNAQFHSDPDYVANATFVIKVGEQPVAHYSRHLYSTNNNGAIYILENDSHADADKLNFYNNLPAGSPVTRIQSDSALVNGESYVITLQWNGVETAMFIDGVKQAETANINLFLGAWFNLAGDNNVDKAFAGVLDLAMFSANPIPDNDIIAWHNTLMSKIR